MTTTIRHCTHVGVSGTTDVHIRRHESGRYEARVGIAIMGASNMDEAGFAACNHDPFHARFHDNFAAGEGDTEQEAIDAMKRDMRSISDSIWAI